MKKVLIISYYWPPSGGSGVQRWLKHVKYLREYNWEPIVFTADNGEVPVLDPDLEKDIPENIEVIRFPIWEPYKFYKKFTGKKQSERFGPGLISRASRGGFLDRLSLFIRGNFFIPDARMFWIRPSVKYIREYLNKNHIDAIISTGPPHTTHMIGLQIKRSSNIPWISDFRDPWTKIDFYKKLKLTKWADRKHHNFEAQVINNSDKVVTVSWKWSDDFNKKYNRDIEVITNGYDSEDFNGLNIELSEKFNISYCGVIKENQNPVALWRALDEICQSNPKFKELLRIDVVGSCDEKIIQSIKDNRLFDKLKMMPYVSHKEVINIMGSSQILLLTINRTPASHGIIPGKLYEYIASRRPVLGVGPLDADSSTIIKETNAGGIYDFEDVQGIKYFLENAFKHFQTGELKVDSTDDIQRFDRKKLAGDFANLLNSLT